MCPIRSKSKKLERINVLFVSPSPTGNILGGAQKAFLNLMVRINKKRFKPMVLLPDRGDMYRKLEEIGIRNYVYPVSCYSLHTIKDFYDHISGLQNRVNFIVDLVRDENIHVIHTNHLWSIDGVIAAGIAQVPHVWHVRCEFRNHPILENFLGLNEDFFANWVNLSTHIIAVSESVVNTFPKHIDRSKISVVYDGVECQEKTEIDISFSKKLRRKLAIPENAIIITTVGRIDNIKRFDDFILIAKHIHKEQADVHFLLVGPNEDPVLANNLKRQAVMLGISSCMHFLGARNDVPSILEASDIFVSTSVSEGLPISLLEAMRARLPIIARSAGGVVEIVVDGLTGFLTPINGVDELQDKVIRLVDDSTLRFQMGKQGEEIVKSKFPISNIDRVPQILEETFEQYDLNDKNYQRAEHLVINCYYNLLSNYGSLMLKMLDYERRLKEIEKLERTIRGNRIYKGLRALRNLVMRNVARITDTNHSNM